MTAFSDIFIHRIYRICIIYARMYETCDTKLRIRRSCKFKRRVGSSEDANVPSICTNVTNK